MSSRPKPLGVSETEIPRAASRHPAGAGTLFGQPVAEPFQHLIGRYPFPARLNEHFLRRLIASKKARLLSKGAVLFKEGEIPNGVYVVVEGRVKMSIASADGKTLAVGFFGSGTVLGIAANVLGRCHEATAETSDPTKVIFIPRRELIREIQNNGTAALQIARLVSESHFFLLGKLAAVELSESVPQAVARFLLAMIAHNSGHDGDSVQVGLSQEAIAEMLGVSRETVSRVLSKLRRERILEWNRSDFVVRDRRALERLAGSFQEVA